MSNHKLKPPAVESSSEPNEGGAIRYFNTEFEPELKKLLAKSMINFFGHISAKCTIDGF